MTAYYNEYEPKAAAWLRELIRRGLIADGVVDERSILDVQPYDLRGFTQCHFFAGIGGWSLALRLAGWPDDRPVWTGSPPCQPFSAAGRQKGKDDERHLAPHFAALVAECRPAVLFGEQVASAAVFGKASSGARKAADDQAAPEWAWLDDLFERLEAAHYACGASDIPAAGVGAAHIRQRTFFGASRLADTQCRERGSGGLRGLRQADGAQGGGAAAELARGCDDVGLADADDAGSQGRDGKHADPGGWQGMARHSGPLRAAVGLANANSGQRRRVADGEGRLGHGAATGRLQGDGEPERGGERGGLADANGRDARAEREQREREQRLQPQDGNACVGPLSQGPAPDLGGGRPRPPYSPWGTADWLFCRDGKWRPVEPGTFPLAHGVSARVGRLRGYGNAIVPQAAAEFVKAFDAASAECFRLNDLSTMTTDNEGVFG